MIVWHGMTAHHHCRAIVTQHLNEARWCAVARPDLNIVMVWNVGLLDILRHVGVLVKLYLKLGFPGHEEVSNCFPLSICCSHSWACF